MIVIALLNEKFASGNMFTAGASGGHTGASGINDLTGRFNFGSYDFPQNQSMTYTTDSVGNITAATISGTDHYYTVVGSYNGEYNPIEVIFSGTSIGSTIKYIWWYQTNGSLSTSTGSLISGTTTVY